MMGRYAPPATQAAHHRSNLGDAHGAHHGIVAEDAAKVLFVGEDLILHGQVNAGRVHDVDYRQAVLHRNLLQAQVLLAGDREPGAGLHGIIVGDDHALPAADVANAAHGAAAGAAAFLLHTYPSRQRSRFR